jgi:transposase InsO family protein
MVRDWNKLKKWKRRPTTIGKVETFHKTYMNETRFFNRHLAFIHHYNHTRPHKALKYLTPPTVYFGDLKV